MGCGCGKPNNNKLGSRRNVGFVPNTVNPNNLVPSTNKTIQPANLQRAAALGSNGPPDNSQYLSPNRLRIERLRREAIDKALKNKQFL